MFSAAMISQKMSSLNWIDMNVLTIWRCFPQTVLTGASRGRCAAVRD